MKTQEIISAIILSMILQISSDLWYWVMVVPFVFAVFREMNMRDSILFGVIVSAASWGGYAIFISTPEITEKVTAMMGLGSSYLLILATTIIAAIAGFVGGVSGNLMRKALNS